MSTKEYLRQYKALMRMEREIEDEIEALRSRYMGKAISYTGMPSSHTPHDLSDYAAEVDLLFQELQEVKLDSIKMYRQINLTINDVTSAVHREVLRLRYLQCLEWKSIALFMNYSEERVYQLHREALDMVTIPKDYSSLQ